MVSQGLGEVSMDQKTHRHLIPKPDRHQNQAFLMFLRLKKPNMLMKMIKFNRNSGLTISKCIFVDAREDGDDDLV